MSGGNIKYTPIKDIIKNDAKDSDYNFYGLIYDASLPLKEENSDNFMCSLKLIDREVNWISHRNSLDKDILNLIIKSSSQENLPFIHCVGDIIRVQRAVYVNILLILYFLRKIFKCLIIYFLIRSPNF